MSDLFDARTALRGQEVLLLGAMRDVQTELRAWEGHRMAQELAGRTVPRELCLLWAELAERERELALALLQVRGALQAAQRDIRARLEVRPLAS